MELHLGAVWCAFEIIFARFVENGEEHRLDLPATARQRACID